MKAAKYCECGKKIVVLSRKPRPRGDWGPRIRSPRHDLCDQCWRALMASAK